MTLSTFKYVLAAVGLVLLLGSLVVCGHTASFVHRAARAQGTITALIRHASTDYGPVDVTRPVTYSFQPVVRFRDDAQHLIQFNDSMASNVSGYHVGETVNVLYLESDPYDARIESFTTLWALPLIFGGIGAIFLAVGAGMMFRGRPANP